jgi:exopolysaccharide biosynthesis polyprenyl glycosylphosphotransferase
MTLYMLSFAICLVVTVVAIVVTIRVFRSSVTEFEAISEAASSNEKLFDETQFGSPQGSQRISKAGIGHPVQQLWPGPIRPSADTQGSASSPAFARSQGQEESADTASAATVGHGGSAAMALQPRTSLRAHPLPAERPRALPPLIANRLLSDVPGIVGGLALSEMVKDRLSGEGHVELSRPAWLYFVAFLLTWLIIGVAIDAYDSRRLYGAIDEFKIVLRALVAFPVALAFIFYLLEAPIPRSWLLTTWVICIVSIAITRSLHRYILRRLRLRGLLTSRILIIGAGREGRDLFRSIARNPHLGFEVVGFLDDASPPGTSVAGFPSIIGATTDVRSTISERNVDAVLVAEGSIAPETAERVYRDLQDLDIDFYLSTGLTGVALNRLAIQPFGDAPVLGVRRVQLTGFQQTVKRAFDLIGGSLLILASGPLLIAGALAVRLSSPGPILSRHVAVGQFGQMFRIRRFRTMFVNSEELLRNYMVEPNMSDGPIFRLQNDPRVTAVGRILRAWYLDRLPELFHVIRGNMSLVGPEPIMSFEADLADAWMRGRLLVKPGMTGLWQVSGSSFDDRVRYDLFYVDNWSLAMDFYILLRTVPAFFRATVT